MPKKKIEKIIVDGNDTTEYTFPKLQEYSVFLLKRLDFARKDRNFLQVQCSQMRTAWEMARMKLEEAKCVIRTTRLKKDYMDEDSGFIKEMKSLENESKFLKREKNQKIQKIINDTNTEITNIDLQWTENPLMLMLEDKLNLKIKNDEELNIMVRKRAEYDEKVKEELEEASKKLEDENVEVYLKEKERLEKGNTRLSLMAENSLIKVQEEYNKLFFLMKTFGDSHFSTLRSFNKKIMDDDVAMILVMKREVKRLEETVEEKKKYCAELKDQIEHLRFSKEKLEASIRRLQNKVKNHRVKLSNCEKSEARNIRLSNQTKAMMQDYTTKLEHLKKLQKQEKVLQSFISDGFTIAQKRQEAALESLARKLNLLSTIAAKDETLILETVENMDIKVRIETSEKLKELRTTSATSLGQLLLGVAHECRNHDMIVEMANANLPEGTKCGHLEKINFLPTIHNVHKIKSYAHNEV